MITEQRPLLLGSASPRRRSILDCLGIPFRVLAGDAVETVAPGEAPLAYLERIAQAKLEGVAAELARAQAASHGPVAAILVADTIVVIDDEIVGKPRDVQDAVVTLSRLVGRTHTVMTRYLVARGATASDIAFGRTVRTEVKLRAASRDEVEAYARTGEGLDKAGAYAAQGIGSFLVEGVNGSYSNVVGLPACELVSDLLRHQLLGAFPRPGAEPPPSQP